MEVSGLDGGNARRALVALMERVLEFYERAQRRDFPEERFDYPAAWAAACDALSRLPHLDSSSADAAVRSAANHALRLHREAPWFRQLQASALDEIAIWSVSGESSYRRAHEGWACLWQVEQRDSLWPDLAAQREAIEAALDEWQAGWRQWLAANGN